MQHIGNNGKTGKIGKTGKMDNSGKLGNIGIVPMLGKLRIIGKTGKTGKIEPTEAGKTTYGTRTDNHSDHPQYVVVGPADGKQPANTGTPIRDFLEEKL